jgi:hypothetical protein
MKLDVVEVFALSAKTVKPEICFFNRVSHTLHVSPDHAMNAVAL